MSDQLLRAMAPAAARQSTMAYSLPKAALIISTIATTPAAAMAAASSAATIRFVTRTMVTSRQLPSPGVRVGPGLESGHVNVDVGHP